MFAQLLAHPGVREDVVLRSSFGFMAFHGGALEEQTDRIAVAAADGSGASCYTVALPPDLHWHVPSRLVRREASERLASFLDHVDVVVAVHGYGRQGLWTSLLLGGGNRALAEHLGRHLAAVLPRYEAVTDLERLPGSLRGLHPDNPVNRARDGGVQLELPPRVRGMGPKWSTWSGPGLVPDAVALVEGLAAAAIAWGAESCVTPSSLA